MADSIRLSPKDFTTGAAWTMKNHSGRTGRECAAVAGGRGGRFRHGLQQLHLAQHGQDRRAGARGDGDLPEGPAGADHASAPRPDLHRRHARQAGADLIRDDDRLQAVAESQVRLQRQADLQIHLQSGALHPGPQRHPGRLSHQRALHDRAAGQVQAPRLPARRLWLSRLCQYGAGAAEADRYRPQDGAGLRRRHARRLDQLSRRSGQGECADQAR